MSRRFFVDLPITGETAVLTGQEAQHLSKVMRAKVDDELILFDGSGAEFSARIEKIGRSEVAFAIIERREVDRELPFRLVVGVALPKGDRQRWLVEKLVELGVAELVPLVTARSVAQPSGSAVERLRRAVVEASKQCGRNRLMTVGEARSFESFLTDWSHAGTRLIAHPPAHDEASASWITHAEQVVAAIGFTTVAKVARPWAHKVVVAKVARPWAHKVVVAKVARPWAHKVVAIGPEGGFTEEEIALASAQHWNRVSLGSRVLRTETAAVAIASLLALATHT